MDAIIEKAAVALEQLATAISKSYAENRSLRDVTGGWNIPTVTRDELAGLSGRLAVRIREVAPASIPPELSANLSTLPARLQYLVSEQIQHFWNGNAPVAVSNYIDAIVALSDSLQPVLGWQLLPNRDTLPGEIVKRIRSADAILNRVAPQLEELDNKVQRINEAYAAAQDLPVVMQDLEEARKSVRDTLEEARNAIEKATSRSSELVGKIDTEFDRARTAARHTREYKEEAAKLVEQCEDAYRITTTKGLAAAFDQRATALSRSMWVWVALLFASLGIAVYIGHDRLSAMNMLLNNTSITMSRIWMQGVLTLFSIAAPVWFAWLATKQIGQRFRLSEDYGFKASVAKAYEGYRKEAARMDADLEKRLFSSALTRLEEAPLRLVEDESHGSPWHEFFSSDTFRQALDKIPGLRGKFEETQRRAVDSPDTTIEAPEKTVVTG